MTPLAIEILLHYNSSPVDYRGGDFSAPAVREIIDSFRGELDMLKTCHQFCGRTYKLTDKAEFYIEYLLSIPLPVKVMKYEIHAIEVQP